jgi:hypothetical protein
LPHGPAKRTRAEKDTRGADWAAAVDGVSEGVDGADVCVCEVDEDNEGARARSALPRAVAGAAEEAGRSSKWTPSAHRGGGGGAAGGAGGDGGGFFSVHDIDGVLLGSTATLTPSDENTSRDPAGCAPSTKGQSPPCAHARNGSGTSGSPCHTERNDALEIEPQCSVTVVPAFHLPI